MMQKQLPNVMNDQGYQEQARDFAKSMMDCKGFLLPCKNFNEFPEWMTNALEKAYLYGAQSAVRVGYLLAEKDYEELIRYYKKQIAELQKGGAQ